MRRAAIALALGMLSSPAVAHENNWYSGLRSPTGIPCCNDRDCRPVDMRQSPDGRTELSANGGWWPVEQKKILAFSSPDGNAHACWGNQVGKPVFLCIILPGEARLSRPDRTFAEAGR